MNPYLFHIYIFNTSNPFSKYLNYILQYSFPRVPLNSGYSLETILAPPNIEAIKAILNILNPVWMCFVIIST